MIIVRNVLVIIMCICLLFTCIPLLVNGSSRTIYNTNTGRYEHEDGTNINIYSSRTFLKFITEQEHKIDPSWVENIKTFDIDESHNLLERAFLQFINLFAIAIRALLSWLTQLLNVLAVVFDWIGLMYGA